MNAAEFRKERHGLSFIIGAALLSLLPFSLGAYAATTPAPKISVSPASVNFSPLKVGGTSSKTVTIKNTGTADLLVDSANITFTGTDLTQFSQTNTCTSSLAKNATCTVSVTFTPTLPYGNKSATLNIPSNGPKSPATVKLSGKAPPPVISASPMSVNLTAARLNMPSAAAKVRIKNTGVSDLNISSANITGTNASLFAATNNCTSPIPKGESCTIGVTFTPDSMGTKSASLEIASDDPKKLLVTVKLTGKASTTYSTADLAGIWTGSRLKTGVGTQVWQRVTLTIAADGSYTSTQVDSDGSTSTDTGKLSMSSDGKISNPNTLCNMDAGKTVIACTDNKSGTTRLSVFTYTGAAYTLDDLAGTWNGNILGAGTINSWTRITSMTIDSGGNITGGSSVDSSGTPGTPSGTFVITPDDGTGSEVFTWSNLQCNMDPGKTVFACTGTPSAGTVNMAVFTKNGNAYTAPDLAGAWNFNGLATVPWWIRVAINAKSDGSYKNQETFYDGTKNKKSTKNENGTLQISADGLRFSSDGNGTLCQVDADETVMTCTGTTGGSGSHFMGVTTRVTIQPSGTFDVTGNWALYITGPSNSESKWGYMSITQSGAKMNTITGTLNTGGTINGRISGDSITLNYVMPCGSLPLIGTVWGSSMSGTWSMGNWRAEKVASVPNPIVVTNKTITVDGNVTDWAGISPIITDAVGDANSTSGSDISAVYIAQDNSNLYFRIDLANGTPGNGLYFGIRYDGDNFTNNSPQRAIFINVGAYSASVSEWATSVCHTSHSNVASGALSINGNLMEISVPKSALNNLPASGFIYVWDDPSGNAIDNTDRVAVTF
jgi:hypothetical protein